MTTSNYWMHQGNALPTNYMYCHDDYPGLEWQILQWKEYAAEIISKRPISITNICFAKSTFSYTSRCYKWGEGQTCSSALWPCHCTNHSR